ncbi:MAG: hypothetical protein OXJ52_02680 [Oligoflexia bacterium]|nr:hypothetical protein [Oligoflexia bacterium]
MIEFSLSSYSHLSRLPLKDGIAAKACPHGNKRTGIFKQNFKIQPNQYY